MTLTVKGSASQSERKILVAIDFGTTYSGVAWAQTARPEIQTTVIQWPDGTDALEGVTNDKVPTELAYDDNAGCKWGFEIPEGKQRYQWFKLELDPKKSKETSYLTVEYPDPNALPTNYIKTAEVLSVDYLTHLREHIIKVLKTKVGEGVIASTRIEYIITVPSDAAKFSTRSCAKRAGMGGDLQIVSEPEAAVIYALDAMDPETLKAGDKFVLCDAGGGTVDLISYTIEELKPVVKISEAAPGSGAACGSTFLNRIFRRYLETTFSDNDGWDDDTLGGALERFETIAKRRFNGDQEDVVIPVPGLTNDRSKGVMRGKLTMSASTLRNIFEPIVTTITALVTSQIRATGDVKAVLLRSGYSACERVTAVVRGALIKALAQASPEASRITIGSRVARKAYGFEVNVAFDPAKHQQSRKFWNECHGMYRINVVDWLVKKGDAIKETEPVVVNYIDSKMVGYGQLSSIRCNLYSFECPTNRNPPLHVDQGAKLLVTLTANLSSIPTKEMPKHTGADGQTYFHCSFEIRVTFHSAHTTYSLWYNNKCYGAVDAEYA
ncbi:hypothetical protein EPUS_03687 [Endocarpon pusillum Z07020]|uniref:Uncharacterized protein n=1 Tax=Endocarpon pusillum (strain Z07020 / HMAS-L-300199) TaxID=1263415 RepID=U1HHR6_ENDPU|nr:uncharacterized protein EPUS_03687 [Endocarpon pusillum Z07020]ERF69695.1 hypothetical protein EPUS_03687 [Endocarpon pusillum Z07020]